MSQDVQSETPNTNERSHFEISLQNKTQPNSVIHDWIGTNTDMPNENLAHLQQAIEYAPVAIVVLDREMRYLGINRRWLEEYNITDDIVGRSHYEIFPDLPEEWRQIHQCCLAGAIKQRDEDCYPRADGSVEWVRWLIRPWHLASGEIGGVLMFSENITQRKQAEEDLRESNALLRSILESTPDLIAVKDRKGSYIATNSNLANFFGKQIEDIIDKNDFELFPPNTASEIIAKDQQIINTGNTETYEEDIPSGDTNATFLTTKAPWRDSHGNILGIIATTRNINDRKQAELALQYGEERYRSLIVAISQMVWTVTADGIITDNPAWREFTGQTLEEFQNSGWLNAIHPQDRQFIAESWERAIKTCSQYQVEFRLRRADGEYRYMLTRSVPVLEVDGKIREWIGTCTDIHDRKQAEIALQHSEERFRSLTEATSQLNWTLNVDGEFTTGQLEWQAFTGQPSEKGMGWVNAIHPDDQSDVMQVWTTAVTNKKVCEVEYRLRRHDGEYRHMNIRSVPLLNADGSIREWFGVHTDITERKQTEQRLRQTLEILDSASDSIIIRDMDDRIIYWNRGAEILYGWKREEVIGQYIHSFLQTVFPKPLETVLSEFLQQGHWEGELHHTTYDGRQIIVASRWTLQRDGIGQPYNQLEINTDITERKQFEVALTQAKEAAEAASYAKSEFLANMSHELRTPLNGILGYAQILQRSKHLHEDERSRIDVIYQCGSHLLTLINDILDLSKIEAQKVELMLSDFHFPAFLQGVAEMCRIRAELKGIQFQYQLASELPIGIRADEKRLRQVLINLLSNAIKFTDLGSVTFTINYVSEGKIRFQVHDTGVGIPQEKIQAIFQPFEQAGDSRRQNEGTGLGLAISQRIVELMDSTIQVQSEVGVGSIFWFDVNLPEADEWVKTSQADDHGQIVGIKNCQPKVLVVDDKWANRSVVSNLLSPIGFEVMEAVNGKEGWQKVSEFQPDLVITDLMMPELDGFELIKNIRESEEFKDIVIIVSSASVFESDQHRSLEAGGDDFLPKPVQAMDLLQKLRKHLDLEWLYEETKPVNQPEQDHTELIAPPTVEIETLYELTMKGNFKGIIKQALLLEQMDEKYIPFAKKLQQLAKGFQDQEILTLIQSYK